MEKLALNLEYCYGIKKLVKELDFSDKRTVAIYSPNGVMKTSLLKTFRDISNDKEPSDLVYPERDSVFDVIDSTTNSQIIAENIFVVESYNTQSFQSDERITTLLVKKELREEYQTLYSDLEKSKNEFLKRLKKASSSTDCESEMFTTFSDISKENLFEILKAIQTDISESKDTYTFKYNVVFDSSGKVKEFLEKNHKLLSDYVSKYEEIISSSSFFKKTGKGTFGTFQAKDLVSSVKDDTYFLAGHSINLEERGTITSSAELATVIDEEIEKVATDSELKEIFLKIDEALGKNQKLSDFKKVLETDNTIIAKLSDYESFKREAWFSYLKQIEAEVVALLNLYDEKKPEIERISALAKAEATDWDSVVEEFNKRFVNLPFKLTITNKHDVILDSKSPAIGFQFDGTPIQRGDLLDVLSQGERRAFYLLDIIFEIKSRKKQGQETIFIIDDIADSFDYKNKYAIVEYLKDISKEALFYQIILTHNFDFYRTVTSRLGIPRKNVYHAVKKDDCIEIIEEVYQNPPFKTWKMNLKGGVNNYTVQDAKKHIVALIPFVRNLIEYGDDKKVNSFTIDSDFDLLTQLLHIKTDTKNITLKNLKEIYGEYLGNDDFDATIDLNDKIYDVIIDLANHVLDDDFKLENKIILAIIIRLLAEEYMFSKVTDKTPINYSQTGVLFGRYKDEFEAVPAEEENIKTLESVNVMTPENIHINSFMYEPILDMGIVELKNLYLRVKTLIGI